MHLKRIEKKKILVCHNKLAKWLEAATWGVYTKAVLFNSKCCEIFKSTYFEEHMWMASSENVFMKLRKIKYYF